MSAATFLAALAGVCCAGGLVELGCLLASRRHRRGRAQRGRSAATAALARLGRALGAPAPPADLALRLDRAGAPRGVTVADVMALKGGAAAGALLTALPLAAALPGRLGVVAVVAGPAGGFLVPDLWLRRRTQARRRAMAAELPAVLALLHVAVEAGLSPMRALSEVGRRHGGPLAAELRAAAARAELGVPRARALARLERGPAPGLPQRGDPARRIDQRGLPRRLGQRDQRRPREGAGDEQQPAAVEGVALLVSAMGRADRHGVALGPALSALAADARARRAQALRERAARAAPKIQLVVALLLVPSAMLVVGAALAGGLR